MLEIEDLEARYQDAVQALHAQAPEAAALRDEAEAFLTQAFDAGLLTEDARSLRIQDGLARLQPAEDASSPALLALHREYSAKHRRLTATHNNKSLEKLLRTEADGGKRKAVYEDFLHQADCAETQNVILKILDTRGQDYRAGKAHQLTLTDLSEVETLISRVAAAIKPTWRDLEIEKPWNLYARLERIEVRTPWPEYRNAAFRLIEEMFGIEVRRLTIPSYHDDVEVYELRDGDGRILGTWHLDPFRRAGKHRGAWTQTALSRRALNDGRMQTPLVFVGLDLVDGLISFTESRSFLHELGHALEHCLSPAPKHTPDTNEISSMYLESFVTQPELLRLFPVDAASLRRQRIQQRTLDLARICLWSKIDLDLHRTRHRCAADLKQTVREAVRTLELSHPLVTPETLTLFDHAFADEEYASTYYSYLLSFVYAQALRNSHGTNSFREFWNGSAVDFTRQTPLSAIDLTGLVEERC